MKNRASFLLAFIAIYLSLNLLKNQNNSLLKTDNETLETNFCKSVDLNNIQYDKVKANQINQQVEKIRPSGSSLGSLILNQSSNKDFLLGLLPLFGPLFVSFLITIFLLFGCFLQCSCRVCCNSRCCQRDLISNPYGKPSIFICSILSILMLISIIGTSIAGISMTSGYNTSSDDLECSTFQFSQSLLYGKPSSSWLGINQLSTKLQQLQTNLTQFQQSLYNSHRTQFSTYNQSNIDTSNISKAINDTFNNNQKSTVTNPILNDTNQLIQPSLIQHLGPPNISTTVTGSLTSEYNSLTVNINSLLNQFSAATNQIGSNFPTIISSLQKGSQAVDLFQSSVSNVSEKTANSLQSFNQYNSKVQVGILVTLSIFLAVSVIGSIAILLMLFFRIKYIKFLVYTTWCFVAWMTIFGFFVGVILLAAAVISSDGCQILGESLGNETQYRLYSSRFFDEGLQNDTAVCLFGTGNLPQYFGFDMIFNDLQNMSQSDNQLNQLASNITSNPRLAQQWRDVITFQEQNPSNSTSINAYDQIYPVPPSSLQAPLAIRYCNTWSDYNSLGQQQFSAGGCKVLLDQVMFNYSDCQPNVQQVNQTSPTNQIGNQVCVQVFDTQFITTRLNSVDFSSCNQTVDVRGQYQNRYNKLSSYKTDLNAVLNPLDQSLTNVQQQNQIVYTQFNQSYTQINGFSTQIQDILDSISNNQTGLFVNSNCKFLREDFATFNVAFCKSYLVEVYTIAIVLVLISIFGFFGMICLFYSTTRLIYWTDTREIQMRQSDQSSEYSHRSEYDSGDKSRREEVELAR